MADANENARLNKALDDLLAALERDSAQRSQEEGGAQARFSAELDKKILGDEGGDANDLYRAQYERQLPTERQAFEMGHANGSSRDELANYAMIHRGQRGNGERQVEVPRDDSAGFESDFAKDQTTRARLADMFGGHSRVSEPEKQRILAEMAKGAQATMAALSGPPATTSAPALPTRASPQAPQLNVQPPNYGPPPAYPSPQAPNVQALDEAALRARGMR